MKDVVGEERRSEKYSSASSGSFNCRSAQATVKPEIKLASTSTME